MYNTLKYCIYRYCTHIYLYIYRLKLVSLSHLEISIPFISISGWRHRDYTFLICLLSRKSFVAEGHVEVTFQCHLEWINMNESTSTNWSTETYFDTGVTRGGFHCFKTPTWTCFDAADCRAAVQELLATRMQRGTLCYSLVLQHIYGKSKFLAGKSSKQMSHGFHSKMKDISRG